MLKKRKSVKPRPIDIVIDVFGGVRSTARLLGISPSTVSRWRSGTGLIPSEHISIILKIANFPKQQLTIDDLIS